MITDTGPIAQALDTAEQIWPDVPRGSALVAKLLTSGAEQLSDDIQTKLAILDSLAELGDACPPGYLAELREDWPD